MKNIKTFESFKTSSSDEYIKSVLSKFGIEYEEDVHDDEGNLCIKVDSRLHDNDDVLDFIFYIFASHPDKEHATYHIQFLVNGRIENNFSTTDLEGSIRSLIEELR
jgi:hypothetical protein